MRNLRYFYEFNSVVCQRVMSVLPVLQSRQVFVLMFVQLRMLYRLRYYFRRENLDLRRKTFIGSETETRLRQNVVSTMLSNQYTTYKYVT